ncbi:hypothetical protein ES708_22293 [subsurface metagenome]
MPIRPVEIMEKHTYDPDKDGIIALAQLVAEVCDNVDTDSKVAAEAAARVVDVDAEETARIADVNAEETARINAINTHIGLPAAHHTKTIDASELTAGILALARLSGITNTQIAAGAAIAYTKLALAGLIRNTDIKSDAAIAESKLALARGTQALFDKIVADIATHAGVGAAHHTKTVDASELTAGILALARLSGITNTQIAAAAAIAYTKLALTGKIKAADIEAGAGIPLTKLEDAVCSETEAATLIATHAADEYAHLHRATLADFQATPASGTFTTTPENINDNNTGTKGEGDVIGQYAEVDFGASVKIDQWRIYGNAAHFNNGAWKIEYYGLDSAWHDWVTGITTGGASWTTMSSETEVNCSKIRLTITTVDSTGWNMCGELEVYHS